MSDNKDNIPEVKLLNSIIDEELKDENDTKLKDLIKRKANTLYPFLVYMTEKNLDDGEIKNKIKSLIEGSE